MDQIEEIQKGVQGIVSVLLLGSVLIVSLAGLFFWLGGLRSLRVVAALSLAGVGFWVARAMSPDAFYVLTLVPIAAGVMGMIFRKTAGALLGILTAGLLGVLVVAAPMLMKAEFWQMPKNHPPTVQSQSGDFFAPINNLKEMAGVIGGRFKELAGNLPARAFTLGTIGLVGAALIAFFRPLWIAALYTSSLGTAMVATGMLILLLYKGAQPLAYVESHPQTVLLSAGVMVLFGALVQGALFKEKKKGKAMDVEKLLQGEKK